VFHNTCRWQNWTEFDLRELHFIYQAEFSWDGTVQSQLLSAFFYGYVITQFPGGYLAERIGSTWVFGLSVFLPGLLTLLHPLLARWDYRALFAGRVVMGLCQVN
jgi:ACS family sodium-dependent inorganic phosphate cotransporter-like MFS transporter 5